MASNSVSQRLEQLKRLLEHDPTDAFTLYAIAQEHAGLGEHGRAIEYYDRAIAADADYLYAYFHKAKSQEESGDLEAAITTLHAGIDRARRIGDQHASSELQAYLEMLT